MMRRLVLAVAALGLVATGAGVAGAAGIPTNWEMTIDPTSGPPGSTFTVQNAEGDENECERPKGPPTAVDVSAPGTDEDAQTVVPVNGDWEATFTVADDASPDDIITVEAECRFQEEEAEPAAFRGFRAQQQPTIALYAPVDFTVTGQETTTTSSSTTTTTTTPSTSTTEPEQIDQSDVAEEVVSTPTLTG